jgi:hypothetical protein
MSSHTGVLDENCRVEIGGPVAEIFKEVMRIEGVLLDRQQRPLERTLGKAIRKNVALREATKSCRKSERVQIWRLLMFERRADQDVNRKSSR